MPGGSMQKLQLTMRNEIGLHARPASIFVKRANDFQADIRICNLSTGSEAVNGKSILSVLSLGVEQGHEIILTAEGPDEIEAINALSETLQVGVAEDDQTNMGAPIQDNAGQDPPVPAADGPTPTLTE
jgi:phosphotransferase system HPr (HPr) family protein